MAKTISTENIMVTFSQSVSRVAEEMGFGKTFGWSEYQLAARSYLNQTGTPNPSPAMVRSLALAVSNLHEEDAAAAVALDC